MTDYDTLKELTESQVLTEPYLSDFRSPAPDWGYLLSKGLNTVEVSKHRLVYLALQAINIESAQTPDHFKHFAILYAARQREFLNSWVLEQGNDAGVQASRSFFQWKREDHESMASSARLMDNEQLDTWMREEIEELENSYDEENDEYFCDEAGIDIAVEHYDHKKDQNNIIWGEMFYHSDADSLFLNPNWDPVWGSNDDTSEDTVLQNIVLYGSFPDDFEDGRYIEKIYEYLDEKKNKLESCFENELLSTSSSHNLPLPFSYGLGHHRNGADPKALSEDMFGIVIEDGDTFDFMKEISESTGLPYRLWYPSDKLGYSPGTLASNLVNWAYRNLDKDAHFRCLFKDFEASVIMDYYDWRLEHEVGYKGMPTPIRKLNSFLSAASSKTADQIIGRAFKYVDLISEQEIENLTMSIKKREWEIGLFPYSFGPLLRELRNYYDNNNTEVPYYELEEIQAVLLRHKDVEKNIAELLEIMLIHRLNELGPFNDTDLRYIDGRFKSKAVSFYPNGLGPGCTEMEIHRVMKHQCIQSMRERNTFHPLEPSQSIFEDDDTSEDENFAFISQLGEVYSKIEGVPLPDKPKHLNPPKLTKSRMLLDSYNIEVRITKADGSGAVSKILTSEISNFLKKCKNKIYQYIGAVSQISDKRIKENISSEALNIPTRPSLVFDIPAQEAVTGLVLLKAMGGRDVDPTDEEFIEDCCRYALYFGCSPEKIRETCLSGDIRTLLDFDTAMKDDIYRYSIAHPDTLPARREVPQPSLCKGFGI